MLLAGAMGCIATLLQIGILSLGEYQDASAYTTEHPVVSLIYTAYLALVIVGFFATSGARAGKQ